MYFDSHAHFDRYEDDQSVDDVLLRARDNSLCGIIAVGGSDGLNAAALRTAELAPGYVHAAIGFDRDQTALLQDHGGESTLLKLERKIVERAQAGSVVAVGELGLDFHYHEETADAQRELFRKQLSLSDRVGLPVIVHSREADDATLRELEQHCGSRTGSKERVGVLHCFTGSSSFAARVLDLGMDISFSGIVTFRNADKLREVARTIPEDRLLLETDSPFLSPVPLRGKRNEPGNLHLVAKVLAEVRECSVERVAQCTTLNARRLFGV